MSVMSEPSTRLRDETEIQTDCVATMPNAIPSRTCRLSRMAQRKDSHREFGCDASRPVTNCLHVFSTS
jgi:hypothetical protein